jgi:hypothetical protein
MNQIAWKKLQVGGSSYYVSGSYPNQIFSCIISLKKTRLLDMKHPGLSSVRWSQIPFNVRSKRDAYQYILESGSAVETTSKSEEDARIIRSKIHRLSDTLHLNGVLVSRLVVEEHVKTCKLNVLKQPLDKLVSELVSKTHLRVRRYAFEAVIPREIHKRVASDALLGHYVQKSLKRERDYLMVFSVPYYLSSRLINHLTDMYRVTDIYNVRVIPE